MYTPLLVLHSWIRWAVLLLGLLAVGRALVGMQTRRPFTPVDDSRGRLFVTALDMQFLVGLILYLWASPFTTAAFYDLGEAMRNPPLRFFVVEHTFGMVAAWGSRTSAACGCGARPTAPTATRPRSSSSVWRWSSSWCRSRGRGCPPAGRSSEACHLSNDRLIAWCRCLRHPCDSRFSDAGSSPRFTAGTCERSAAPSPAPTPAATPPRLNRSTGASAASATTARMPRRDRRSRDRRRGGRGAAGLSPAADARGAGRRQARAGREAGVSRRCGISRPRSRRAIGRVAW